ncbi:MAG: hypothetical protein K0Q90_3558, partial [Paenibacillaceae bacterium]|nr:hypothetical protein [Paenibacillaceae bacterium]
LCSSKEQTVLLVTHDPEEAYRLADRVYVAEGPPLSVVKQLDVAAFCQTWAAEEEDAMMRRFHRLLTGSRAD